MRVISWNANSIRARSDRLRGILERHAPDALLVQETKVDNHGFPFFAYMGLGYEVAAHGQKAYNGVAIFHKGGLEDVKRGFPGDPVPEQSRVISGTLDGVRLVNVYVVNGKHPDDPAFDVKMRWLAALRDWIDAEHDPGDQVLVTGDFNIAPDDRDVWDPEKMRGTIHCTPEERAALGRFHDWGLQDLVRDAAEADEAGLYTWWGYMGGAFARDHGMRIDLGLATPPLAGRLKGWSVDREERKQGSWESKPSDHAPLVFDFK